jgi:hypothetical protein
MGFANEVEVQSHAYPLAETVRHPQEQAFAMVFPRTVLPAVLMS